MTKKRITSPQVQESGTDKQDEIRQSVGPIILLAMSGKDSGKKAKNVKKGTKEKVQKTLSHNDVLAQKFSELTPEKKREYMCIVRGTIR